MIENAPIEMFSPVVDRAQRKPFTQDREVGMEDEEEDIDTLGGIDSPRFLRTTFAFEEHSKNEMCSEDFNFQL